MPRHQAPRFPPHQKQTDKDYQCLWIRSHDPLRIKKSKNAIGNRHCRDRIILHRLATQPESTQVWFRNLLANEIQDIGRARLSPWPRNWPVHIMPEKFKNGAFSLKLHQMFSVHTTPGKLKDATINGHFGFAFGKNRYSWGRRFRIAAISRWFSSSLNHKALKSIFQKLRFGDGLVWKVGLILK